MPDNIRHNDERPGIVSKLLDGKDQKLIALLSENARASAAELARQMGMSRTTLQDRINRLERAGVIAGYTVRLADDHAAGQVRALVMIRSEPKAQNQVVISLKNMPAIRSLHTSTGSQDLVAVVTAQTTSDLDAILDAIAAIKGIERTRTSILLATKFDR